MKCQYHLPFRAVGSDEHFGGSPDFHEDMEDAIDRIQVMKEQQKSYLMPHNYLEDATNDINDGFRRRMCLWCFQVVDSYRLSRYTAYAAMSCADRFFCTKNGKEHLTSQKSFQLVVVTALYIAIKVHEPMNLDDAALTTICRGVFDPSCIRKTEEKLLIAINWCVNPPSPQTFVIQFVAKMPSRTVSPAARQKLLDLTSYQNDQALSEMSLMAGISPSAVAMAIFFNALSFVPEISGSTSSLFIRNLGKTTGCTRFLPGVKEARKLLREHANFAHHHSSDKDKDSDESELPISTDQICSCFLNKPCNASRTKRFLSPKTVINTCEQ